MADIFEEVDEEVRKDQFSEIWKKYGKFIVTGSIIALASSVGYVLWGDYQVRQQTESSAQFEQALELINAKKEADARAITRGRARRRASATARARKSARKNNHKQQPEMIIFGSQNRSRRPPKAYRRPPARPRSKARHENAK